MKMTTDCRVAVLALLIAVCSSACMLSPNSGDIIASKTTPVNFSFYATAANKPITVECAPGYYGSFTQIFTINSGSSPWTYNGETVYPTSTTRVVPDHCWEFVHGRWMTRLQPKQESYSMKVYSDAGVSCIGNAFGQGKGPVTAGNECALTYSNSTKHMPFILFYADP